MYILSEFTIVVNNDADKGWTTIFSKFKKEIPEITEDVKAFFDLYSKEPNTNLWNANDLLKFADSVGGVDENFKKFLSTADTSGDLMAQYQKHLQSASSATSKFGATLKSAAANFGIMLAVSFVIKGITEAWDYFNETVEESQEKIDAINKKLETLNAEKAELTSKNYDTLSKSEKDRLDYLNERIALEKELKEIESIKEQKEQIGGGFTDFFDTDSYTHKIFFEKFVGDSGLDLLTGGVSEHSGILSKNTMDDIKEYEYLSKEISRLKEEILKYDKDSNEYDITKGQLLARQKELENSTLEDLREELLKFKEKKIEYTSEIDSINNILSNPYITGSTRKKAKEDLSFYQEQLTNAENFVRALDEILHSPQSESASVAERLGERFTSEELMKEFGEDGISLLVDATFDENASKAELHNLIEKRQAEANEKPVVITTVSDALSNLGKLPHNPLDDAEGLEETEDATDYLKEYQDKVASLQQYLEKIRSHSFDSADTINLAREFDIAGDSVSDIKKQILSLMDSSTSEILSMIDELISSSQVEEGTKEKLLDIKDALKGINDETQSLNGASSSVTSVASALSDVTDVLDKVNSAYQEFMEDGKDGITSDSISGIVDAFKDIKDVDTDSFIKGIVNAASSTDVQNAFNTLVSQYLNASGCMENITDETASYITKTLKEHGVTNADELVRIMTETIDSENELINNALTEYENYLNGKEGCTLDFINSASSYNSQLMNALGDGYSNDYKNWISLLQQKAAAYNKFASAIASSVKGLGVGSAVLSGKGQAEAIIKKSQTDELFGKTTVSAKDKLIQSGMGINDYYNRPTNKINQSSYTKEEVQAAKDYLNLTSQIDSLKKNLTLDLATIGTNFGASYSPAKTGSGSKKSGSEKEKDTTKEYDWIERAVNRVTKAYDKLKITANSVYNAFSKRNYGLSQEYASLSEQISIQQQAYEGYLSMANSTGLPQGYRGLVESGAISIEDIQDETLQDQIEEYKKYYDAAIDASHAVGELREQQRGLSKEKFDLIGEEYEDRISLITNQLDLLNKDIDYTEKSGYFTSEKFYKVLEELENQNIAVLQNKKVSLINTMNNAINSGDIEKESESWYEMVNAISDVDKALSDANSSLLEYKNNIRDLQWEIEDYIQDTISKITDESDFLIGLMENDKLFDDSGNFTKEGLAAAGLHGTNYNVYMNEADKYNQDLRKLNEDLAKDPYNQDLLERKYELLEAQREAIEGAESEKEAIRDLVEEGINVQLDAMQKLIDKRKEALQAEKDLYDYQKRITEQTKAIGDIQKQMEAYKGDNSEETKKKVQELKVSLEEAKANLEETEYDKYISDQEKLLDDLYVQYEEILNMRLDDIDALMAEIIEQVNASASDISGTISSTAESVGYNMTDQMKSIWDANTSNITNVLSTYGNGFLNAVTTVNNTINGIKALVQQMVDKANAEAAAKIAAEQAAQQAIVTPPPAPAPPVDTSGGGSSGSSGSGGGGGFFRHKKDSYPKNRLRIDTSVVDRLKWHDFDSSFSARRDYYSAMGFGGAYTGSDSQNIKMLSWMKSNGYKKGSRYIQGDQMNWTHEGEVIYRPSDGAMLTPLENGGKVFTKEQSNRLWELSQNPQIVADFQKMVRDAISVKPYIPEMPEFVMNNNIKKEVVLNNEFNIEMNGVNDPVAFTNQVKHAMQYDRGIRNVMKDTVLGEAMGRNPMIRYTR